MKSKLNLCQVESVSVAGAVPGCSGKMIVFEVPSRTVTLTVAGPALAL